MIDHIASGKGEIFARIDYEIFNAEKFWCEGRILEFNFPENLEKLIREREEIINQMALSLLDEVEDQIYAHDLRLVRSGQPIFSVSFEGREKITFFTKYPTSRGFLNSRPL